MVKYSKLLLHSFFVLSTAISYSMKEADYLSKSTIKDMIINYQITEESVYLAELLSLPRTNLNGQLSQSLNKYKRKLQEYSNYDKHGKHYAQDLEKTKCKVQQIKKCLEKNNNENLLASLKIQELLIKEYEAAIKDEKLNKLAIILEKITRIYETLSLTDTDSEKEENQKLYRQLSLLCHSDKINDDCEEIKRQKNEFLTSIEPLLRSNKVNNHLSDIIKSIKEKQNEIIERINNPSALTCISLFLRFTTLPVIGKASGKLLCHKTFDKLMPRSEGENILHDICIAKTRETALEIETKLVKLSRHP